MEQLKVCLVRFPYTNLIDYKIRPSIIISNDKFNETHNYFLWCPITSQKRQNNQIKLNKDNFKGELKTESFINTDSIFGIEKDLFLKEIGSINQNTLEKIKHEIFKNI